MPQDPAQPLEVAALVARGAELEVEPTLRSLGRIAPLLTRDTGQARGRFRFFEESGSAVADGTVSATLVLTCQRCLGDVSIPVTAQSRLAFVAAEADCASVPESREAVLVTDGRIALTELVEDELLLAMPPVPVHESPEQCGARQTTQSESQGQPTQRPFAGLRDLLKTGR